LHCAANRTDHFQFYNSISYKMSEMETEEVLMARFEELSVLETEFEDVEVEISRSCSFCVLFVYYTEHYANKLQSARPKPSTLLCIRSVPNSSRRSHISGLSYLSRPLLRSTTSYNPRTPKSSRNA
jgi:hypothetical protein